MKEIIYLAPALQALNKHRNQSKFLVSKIFSYAEKGTGNIKTLVNRNAQKRLRVGDYRVIFIETDDIIEIQTIGHRDDVYK
jgi:mRNA interferase RelE/StbE